MGTYLPGQNRTVLIAGHNNSYFLTLKNVQEGDMVEIRTNYAVYTYRITGKQIARHDDTSAYRFDQGRRKPDPVHLPQRGWLWSYALAASLCMRSMFPAR